MSRDEGVIVGPLVACILLALTPSCKRAPPPAPDDVPSSRPAMAGCGDLRLDYVIQLSRQPDGTPGSGGTVTMGSSEETCRVTWNLSGNVTVSGVGIRTADRLGVGWGDGDEYGVAIYTIAGGNLHGVEAENASYNLAVEELAGPVGLSGDFKIVRAENHHGVGYTGHVSMSPRGAVYALEWNTECLCASRRKDHYVGVGIRDGDKLVVAWGTPGSDIGVASYHVNASALEGTWATYGGTQLGAETLVRAK